MKKLFLLAFVLAAGISTMNAQQRNWQELSDLYQEELYPLAKDISEQTDKVIAHGNVISIVKSNGTTSIAKRKIEGVPVEAYSFHLITSKGREINLKSDMLLANKVINKFYDVLVRVKESLKEDNTREIESILDNL